jgi:hypothetical protein
VANARVDVDVAVDVAVDVDVDVAEPAAAPVEELPVALLPQPAMAAATTTIMVSQARRTALKQTRSRPRTLRLRRLS